MAKVSLTSVNFSTTPTPVCTCDRCGQGIKNVWTLSFSNDVTYHYGIDCFEKLSKHSNLSDIGKKHFKEYLKSLKKCESLVSKWANITFEEYEQEYWSNIKDEDKHLYCPPLENEWINPLGLDWEGFKAWKYDCRVESLNDAKKKLDNFKKVWFIVD